MSTPVSRSLPRVKFLCAVVSACFAAESFANPVGPSVVAGQASFAAAGSAFTVTNSPNAIINWQGFSIGTGEITRFQQQSAASAVLNRVVGQDPSAILGTLSSNGQVYLVNPNGILFGQGSRIDVAGLVASTLNISNQDFLARRLNFEAGTTAGSLVNRGDIVTGSGGRVLLIAPDVQNHGLISSPQGEVVLAAGKSVQLVEVDLPMLKVEVNAGGEALNVGGILAEGGKIGVYAGLINQRGVVRADSASVDASGRIVFRSSDTTLLEAGSVTSAAGAKGGEIQVLGDKVGLTGDAKVDASGEAGGGTVLIGGDFQGKNPEVQNAFRTYFGAEATIKADAITSGDGGKVIVWSDDATRAYGRISARGGALAGDGGFVEVSGKNWLDFSGTVTTSAPIGRSGTLLLDPSDVTLSNSADNLFSGSFLAGVFAGATSSLTNISWGTIDTQLGSTSVVITTSGSGGSGNITVGAAHTYSSFNNLSLLAHNDVTVNGAVNNTGAGNVSLVAGWDGVSTASPAVTSGVGSVNVNQSVTAKGANLSVTAGKDIAIAGGVTVENSRSFGASALSLTAGDTITAGTGSVIRSLGGTGAPGGAASLTIAAKNAIGMTGSTVTATGGNDSGSGGGGNADIIVRAGAGVDLTGSTLTSAGGTGSSTGVGNVRLEVSSVSGNAAPSGDIKMHNITANDVNVQQQSKGVAKSILRASSTSLITATQLLLEIDDPDNVVNGSVGTSADPIRVQVAKLEAHTHETSPGIFIDSPNAGNLQLGGVSFFGGSVKGVQNVTSGDISIGVNGTLTLLGGSTNAPCGTGTGGPICTTNGSVTLRAEDMVIGHSVAGTGTVALAPYSQSRQVNIESSASGGVLSLTPAEIAFVSVPSGVLEIGRSDGNATMVVGTALSSAAVNAGTLRLYSGNINLTTASADIGSSGTPFAHNLELKANNDVNLTVGNVYVADNKTLTVVADNDSSGFGNLNIGGVTVKVGSSASNTTGNMNLSAREMTIAVSGGGSGVVQVTGSGNQTLTTLDPSGELRIENQNTSTGSLNVGTTSGTQTVNAAGALKVIAGTGSSTNVGVTSNPGSQVVTAGTLLIQGGGGGTNNFASVFGQAGQTVSAGGITMLGGTSGGGSGVGNLAYLSSAGSQSITVGSGGLTLTGGGGTGLDTDNAALLIQSGTTGTTQTITVNSGGSILLNGGSSALTGVGATHGSRALIEGDGDSQLIQFTSGGAITANAGTVGSRNFAVIYAKAGTQTITGSPSISISGGTSGGIAGEGNYAHIWNDVGTQTITASGITLAGGSGGTENRAQIGISGASASQVLNITGGGSVLLTGGGGTNNYSRIYSGGLAQTLAYASGGSLSLQGGTGAQGNAARMQAFTGTQTISGSPTLTLTGGTSGGVDTNGNPVQILANAALQTITAGTTTIQAGLGGTNNFAVIEAPNQNITVNGNLSLTGGNSVAGTIGSGGRIGGLGGGSPSATNLTLDVTGDVSLTGGTQTTAGTAIGSATLATPQNTNITMTVGGNLTLTGGSAAGSRIGSASTSVGGGDISVTATGSIAVGDSSPGFGTSVRTKGNVLLKTTGASSDITLGGTVDVSAGPDTSSITLDAGRAIVSTGGQLLLNSSTIQTATLKAVAGIGTQSDPIRFSDADLSVLNTGTSGDIAVSLIANNAVIDGDLNNVLNSNPNGVYYIKSEAGNVQLDIPFTPNGLALASGQSVVFAAPTGSVVINPGGSIAATGSGGVTFTAGNTGTGGFDAGVLLDGGTVTTQAGAITITGQGKSGTSFAPGVLMQNGGVVSSASGAISLSGTGGAGALGGGNRGVFMRHAGTRISTTDGAVTLVGMGGSSTGFDGGGSDGNNRGIYLLDGAAIEASGAGAINLTGTGGTSVDMGRNSGILLSDSCIDGPCSALFGTRITAVNGNVTLVGTGGTITGPSSTEGVNRGISIGFALIRTTGTGSISLTGTAGSAVNNSSLSSNTGILVQGDTAFPTMAIARILATGSGSISITGTGGNTTGSGGDNSGIAVGSVVTIAASGSGGMALAGVAGTSADSTPNAAIAIQGAGVLVGTVSGAQTINATGDIEITADGGSVTVGSGGSQTVTASGALAMTGGTGTNESALLQSDGAQSIAATSIELTGGGMGSGNFARIYSGGNQTIGADAITLNGGLGGGIADAGNFALIRSDASQAINVGSGGLVLYGGSGTGSDTDNFANVYQAGTSGTQIINVAAGGAIGVQGGDAAATNVDVNNNHGSWAFIRSDGTAQTINFAAPGDGSFESNLIAVLGGDTGSGNYAGINARNGTQSITGSPDIVVAGGSTGGVTGEGNWAQIYANAGQQSIAAAQVYVAGGEGTETFARLWSGTQQNITASTIWLLGGGAGTANYAVLNAPSQTISSSGDLMLIGGASAATATSGGGARIGGFGGSSPSATNVTVTVGGNLVMSGGDVANSGTAIGSGILGGQTTDVTLNVTGSVILNPGTVANAGSRIGSPAAGIAGGTIAVTAGGSIVLNDGGASGIGTAIRTSGDVSLQANSIAQSTFTTIAANQLTTTTAAGASLLGGGNQMNAFSASNTASGAIELLNTSPTLTLTGLTQVPGGAINIAQTGDLVLPTMTFGTGAIGASGTESIPSGVTFTVAGGTLTAATLDVQSGGTLNGTGTVTANVSNSGTVAPGTSVGILTVSGNYTQTAGGALTVEIGGTTAGSEYDRLSVSGTATLGGTLNVLEGAVAPVLGTSYTVITCGSCSGTFSTVNAPAINSTPTYGVTSFSLPFTAFINSWTGGASAAWEDPANWGRGSVPTANDDVIIDVPSILATITISSGTQSARSIVTNENLALTGGGLNLAAPSTVNGDFTMSGGTLSGAGSLTVNGNFTQSAGTQSGTGSTTFGPASTATLSAVAISRPLVNQGSLVLNGTTLSTSLTNSGTLNVSGSVSASGGIEQSGGLITVPIGQTLAVGGSGLLLSGGTLMGNGSLSGNVNNTAGTVAPGASPGILTINGNYTQGVSGTLAVEVAGTTPGTQYDQLVVSGNATLAGNLTTTLIGTYTPLPGDNYTFIDASGTISGTFANINQPPSLQLPVVIVGATGGAHLTVAAVSQSVPPAIAPTYNYTVVATQISSEPVESILVPVLGIESTTTSGETTLEKKPPACS